MFFAAADVIRTLRNTEVHSGADVKGHPAVEFGLAARRFGDTVKFYGRGDMLSGRFDSIGTAHGRPGYFARIALAAQRWLGERCKMAETQTGSAARAARR